MLLPILLTLLHILTLSPALYSQSIVGTPITWSYDHDSPLGPAHWSTIDPSFSVCSSGLTQSPINLPLPSTLPSRYPSSSLSIHWDDLHTSVHTSSQSSNDSTLHSLINNGHAIQVKFDPSTHSHVTYQSTHYTLAQFHFHAPSEHTVNDQYHDMELHLVHQNDQGELLVVGVFIDADPNEREGEEEGSAVDFLKALSWSHLPSSNSKGESSSTPLLSLLSTTLSSSSSSPSFYHYPGSLTTPPCSEGVEWFVLTNPLHILPSQLSQYSTLFHNTARPTQPLHSRSVVLVSSPAHHPVVLLLVVMGLIVMLGVVGGVWGCMRWFHRDTLDEGLTQSMMENVVRDKAQDKEWKKERDNTDTTNTRLARRSTYQQDDDTAPLLTSSSTYPIPPFPSSSPTTSPHTRMLRRVTGSRSGSNGNLVGSLKLDGDEKKGEGDVQNNTKDNVARLR